MKQRTAALALGLFAALASFSGLQAQPKRAPAPIQAEFDQLIGQFRTALKANDAAAVATLTRMPFTWDGQHDAASFQKSAYPKLFPAKNRKCLASGKAEYDRDPEGNHNFSMFCGDEVFVFTKTPAGMRLTEVGAND